MKTSSLSVVLLTLALSVAGMSASWADPVQNGYPGAQGTEGTNPTHQDQSPTGPNGQHSTNTNPTNDPPVAAK